MDAEVYQHLRASAVVAQVRGEAQFAVGFNGVVTLILQGVGADFVGKPDAAPFLTHVKQRAAPFFFNLAQGRAKLAAAVAA